MRTAAANSIAGLLIILGLTISPVFGQQPPGGQDASPDADSARKVLAEHFFAPQLILQSQSELGLNESQVSAINALVANMENKLPELQQQHEAETKALSDQLAGGNADETVVLTHLDNVIKQERLMRRLQIITLLRVRSQLTAAQQSAMKDIRQRLIAQQQQLQQRLQEKFNRVRQLAIQMQQAGQQPAAHIQALTTFQQKLQQGDVAGAEAALDQVLQPPQQPILQGLPIQGNPQ